MSNFFDPVGLNAAGDLASARGMVLMPKNNGVFIGTGTVANPIPTSSTPITWGATTYSAKNCSITLPNGGSSLYLAVADDGVYLATVTFTISTGGQVTLSLTGSSGTQIPAFGSATAVVGPATTNNAAPISFSGSIKCILTITAPGSNIVLSAQAASGVTSGNITSCVIHLEKIQQF